MVILSLKLNQLYQRVGSPTIIKSEIAKLKNFVKFCQGEISNSRYVKFFKITAGSAHVCQGVTGGGPEAIDLKNYDKSF